MMLQGALTPDTLLAKLVAMLNDEHLLRTMGERARQMAKPGALNKIAALCVQVGRTT